MNKLAMLLSIVILGQVSYPLNIKEFGITLPRIKDDMEMNDIIRHPNTIYYKLPQLFQRNVEHRPDLWGIFKSEFQPEFNANLDFPWETTIGLNISHKSINNPYNTVNFLKLPDDIPILVFFNQRPIEWIFPAHTTVGEIIYVTHNGKKYVQEIRTRTKTADNSRWMPNVYRAVKNEQEFFELASIRRQPLAKKFFHFRNTEEDEVFRLDGYVDRLPNIPPEKVTEILSLPFKNVTNSEFHPSADTNFHIVPKDYTFGLLKVDSVSCAECHKQTGISVKNLIPKEPIIYRNPDKVGNIRGKDAVFTWHPFHESSTSGVVYLRKHDLENNIIRIYDKKNEPRYNYMTTRFVQKALLPFELPSAKFWWRKTTGEVENNAFKLIP